MTKLTQDTRAVRAGLENCDVTGAVVPPLHLSSTYAFRGFGDKRKYDYSRSGNPTRDLLAEALADLEGGVGAVITGSGMGAITLVGHLLPARARASSRRMIVTAARFAAVHRLEQARRAQSGFRRLRQCGRGRCGIVEAGRDGVDRDARAIRSCRITDIADIARRSHAIGALVVADNTFLSPVLAAAPRTRRRHRGAFDDQVHQRTQRRGRRGGDPETPELAEEAGWWGNCLGLTGSAFRQLPHPARTAHAARGAGRASTAATPRLSPNTRHSRST